MTNRVLQVALAVVVLLITAGVATAFTYQIDDGTAETGRGPAHANTMAWLNSFQVQPGAETLTSIEIAYLSASLELRDQPVNVYLWTDPTNDGDPTDATVARSVPSQLSPVGAFVNIPIDPLTLPVGSWFFAGGIFAAPADITAVPAAVDSTDPILANRSYFAVWDDGIVADPNDLSVGAFLFGPEVMGNYLLRVNAVPEPSAVLILVVGGAMCCFMRRRSRSFARRAWGLILGLGLGGMFAVQPASALDIVFTDIGATPMTTAQLNAFNQAAQIWENAFIDPITVMVNIAFDPPSSFPRSSILGSTQSARTTSPYGFFQPAAISDSTATEESLALSLLPSARVPITDINGSREAESITMSTANAKALGLGTGLDLDYGDALRNNADADIRFNTNFGATFDYDRSDGIGASSTDFVAVATHEIGHALGFISLTDVQDANPTRTLYPSPLDVFRFAETGGDHDLLSESRFITAGPAEYYDTVQNNVSFSQGVTVTTDPNCFAGSGSCQASHWRDDQFLLMKASFARGVSYASLPLARDLHALDYIGWDPPRLTLPRRFYPVVRSRVGWYGVGGLLPDFSGAFDDFAPPPDKASIPQADFEPNAAIRLGIDLGIAGLKARGALGLARFEEAEFDPNAIVIVPPDHGGDDHNIEGAREPMKMIPPRITDFMFISEDSAVQFAFTDALSDSGAMFDSTLGNFGGYRIAGFVDGYADKVIGDIDGMMTILLLADDVSGVPDPEKLSLFQLAAAIDNVLFINDPLAFGIPEPHAWLLLTAGIIGVRFSRRMALDRSRHG